MLKTFLKFYRFINRNPQIFQILLGLVTHEVHFSLLREEVKFGKAQKRITSADEQCFHLLHLSLFREYIDKEFHCLKVF